MARIRYGHRHAIQRGSDHDTSPVGLNHDSDSPKSNFICNEKGKAVALVKLAYNIANVERENWLY